MRKILLLLILLLLVFLTGLECKIPSKPVKKKLASFQDILKPGMIIVRGGRLFVTEGATVSIYSLRPVFRPVPLLITPYKPPLPGIN